MNRVKDIVIGYSVWYLAYVDWWLETGSDISKTVSRTKQCL